MISESSDCACASTKAVAMLAEFSTMALVLVENQLSRPRSSVTLATTATRMAGVAATMLKSATIRMWSRAAARRRCRARTSAAISQPMTRMSRNARLSVEDEDGENDRLGRRDRRHAHEDEEGPDGDRERGHDRDVPAGPHQTGELEAPPADRRTEERRRVDRHPFTRLRFQKGQLPNPPPAVTRLATSGGIATTM